LRNVMSRIDTDEASSEAPERVHLKGSLYA
jgi:hypothetical protein